jgi:hypothetical protein
MDYNRRNNLLQMAQKFEEVKQQIKIITKQTEGFVNQKTDPKRVYGLPNLLGVDEKQ